MVRFNVQFSAAFICVRCLGGFSRDFKADLLLSYVQGTDPYLNVEKVNLKKTDIDKVYYTGNHIDLGIGIREAIILSIPIAPLCKKDCAGLCPVCGKNRNKSACKCKVESVGLFTPVTDKKASRKKVKQRQGGTR